MCFVKAYIALTAAALASVMAGVGRHVEGGLLQRQTGNNCQEYIGNCFQNGCEGTFSAPSDTIGTCSAGDWRGCPCDKCGSGDEFIGGCTDSGCDGFQGTCTVGTFQGCPCSSEAVPTTTSTDLSTPASTD